MSRRNLIHMSDMSKYSPTKLSRGMNEQIRIDSAVADALRMMIYVIVFMSILNQS